MIVIENLSKFFQTKHDKVAAIDDVSLEVRAGEIISLLGPSGCGKTTTLRCVAGLERPDSGRIVINDKTVMMGDAVFMPPQHRRLGMVFQSYAIWPHMTVLQNVAYALGGRGLSRSEIRKEAVKALSLVKLEAYADRPAPRLSGGQQQRVAIARAIAGQPDALLFDEPLSNLDAKLRAEMRNEIRRLQQQVGLTSIYVTHDQSEALTIADWIVVMRDGKIVERGRPTQIYRYPKNIFTAHFIGNTNLIAGNVQNKEGHYVCVDSKVGRLIGVDTNTDLQIGDDVEISIRPEDMDTAVISDGSQANSVTGIVDFSIFAGAAVEAELKANGQVLKCILGRDEVSAKGEIKTFHFKAEDCVVLRADRTLPKGEVGKVRALIQWLRISDSSANQAIDKYLADLRRDDLLIKIDWDQWLQIEAPYRAVTHTKKEVTTRFERNGYDWVMHGSVYEPVKEVNPGVAFFLMHGSGDNENNLDVTPDGRPGLARVLASQGFKVLSVSYPGHYPPGGIWPEPEAPRQPVYLFDQRIPDSEALDRNYKATVFVTLQGAAALIDQTLAGRELLAFGQATSGGIVTHLQPFIKDARIVGLPGLGSGGPDGWKREWADTVGAYTEGNAIDTLLRRGVAFFVSAGYQDEKDLCPWGGPEEYMAWADKYSSQMKPALTDNQYNGIFPLLEEVVTRTGLRRTEFFGHFQDPDPDWLRSVNVLLLTGERDPGHWIKGGAEIERKREIFMARKYVAAGCRVHVVLLPRYGHLAYAELHNEKIVYLWLWAYRSGYFTNSIG